MANLFGFNAQQNTTTGNTNGNNGGNQPFNPRKKGQETDAHGWLNPLAIVVGKDANGKFVYADFSQTAVKPLGTPLYLTDGKVVRTLLEKAEQNEDNVEYVLVKCAIRRSKEKPQDDGAAMDIIDFSDL